MHSVFHKCDYCSHHAKLSAAVTPFQAAKTVWLRNVGIYTSMHCKGWIIRGVKCRVWRHNPESDWQETWVQTGYPAKRLHTPKEVMKPVTDPLIWACLAAAQDLQQDRPSMSWLHATMDWVLASGHPSIYRIASACCSPVDMHQGHARAIS